MSDGKRSGSGVARLAALLKRARFELRLAGHMIQFGEVEVTGDVRAMVEGLRRNASICLRKVEGAESKVKGDG